MIDPYLQGWAYGAVTGFGLGLGVIVAGVALYRLPAAAAKPSFMPAVVIVIIALEIIAWGATGWAR